MNKLFRLLGVAIIGLSALSCYDDSELRGVIKDHEDRLVALETLARNLNSDIESLKTLIEAIEDSDYIISVTPVVEDRVEVGYEIKFAKSGTITIYHGADGEDGKDGTGNTSVPVIGVRKGSDGVYYWTIDGEYLLDSEGNPVPASGADGADGDKGETGAEGPQGPSGSAGADGVTPQLKIEEGYWYVSYDYGTSWTRLGKATGEDGKDGVNGGDGLFKDVYEEDGYVCFVLSDGTVYEVPMAGSPESSAGLDIIFDVEQGVAMVPGAEYEVGYTVIGGDENTIVRVMNVDTYLSVTVEPETSSTGHIVICIQPGADNDDNEYHSSLALVVSVSDGRNNSVMKSLNISEGVVKSVLDTYVVDAVAGTFSVQLNVNLDYDILIPESATWLSLAPASKAAMRFDEIEFAVETNYGDSFRVTDVYLTNTSGNVIGSFAVFQRAINADWEIDFADSFMKQLCTEAFDTNEDGVLTYEEAAFVTDLSLMKDYTSNSLFQTVPTHFNELKHFKSVRNIPDNMFYGCENLKSVTLPSGLTKIGARAFNSCISLENIILPESLAVIGNHAFYNTAIRGESIRIEDETVMVLTIPASVTVIGDSAFKSCKNLHAVRMMSEIPCTCTTAFGTNTEIYVPDGCYEQYMATWEGDYYWHILGPRLITIDGYPDDWDAIDPSLVSVAECDADAFYTALHVFKVYADQDHLYAYVEYDMDMVYSDYVPFHLFLNSDGDSSTGGYLGGMFLTADCDIMLEGGIYMDYGPCVWDPWLYDWKGENGADGWDGWSGPNPDAGNNWGALVPENSGLATSAGENGKLEISVSLKALADWGFPLADRFGVSAEIECNWETVGLLPNAPATADNLRGAADKLEVVINYESK